MAEVPSTTPDAKSAQTLADLRAEYGRPPRLGCSLVAHRDLGFCAFCPVPFDDLTRGSDREITGWRLLAMSERGIPHQPSENTATRPAVEAPHASCSDGDET